MDFAAAINTARALELKSAHPDELFNVHRQNLISSFGLFATRMWAQHIHDRFRDAASAQAPSYALQLPNPDRVVRSFEHFTWAPSIRAARNTAASAAALKRAMPWPDLPLLPFPIE